MSGESDEALEHGFRLAETLGLRPFELADADRPLYHAGAVFAASFLVTLHEAAAELLSDRRRAARGTRAADAADDRRTASQPTGPFIRGDRGTIERNLAAIHERRPELEPLYRHLAAATEELVAR